MVRKARNVMQVRYPIAYVRRSSADANDPGDVSREAQESAVHELARREGHNGDLRILVDWDCSADEAKESKRTAFLAMLSAIERGEVSAVYAASLDRLYRSLQTFVRLTDAARSHDVRIVTLREGVLGGDGSPMAQAFAEITAVFSGLELRTTKARAAGALAVRRSRGDHIGRPGYGRKLVRNDAGAIVLALDPEHPLEPVLAAVREAGSILGAAKLLQARGIPSPTGGTVWSSTGLRRIVEREAPELIPPVGPRGRRTPTHSTLSQLLVCHCGHVLTPEPARAAYRCYRGNRLGVELHGRTWVSESALLPWLKAESERLAVPGDLVEVAAKASGRADAIRARLARASELYLAADISRERFEAVKATASRELADLEAEATVVNLPTSIDWTAWTPQAINGVLRAMWKHVELDDQMHPVRAEWLVPEWRTA